MEKDELTYKIIGCAMKVHNTLGNGFQEVIYQVCLLILEQSACNTNWFSTPNFSRNLILKIQKLRKF